MTDQDLKDAWAARYDKRSQASREADAEFVEWLNRYVDRGGSISEAARVLGVHRVTLHRLLRGGS